MKIGLIGNQNSGKTTLFNYLTGMNAKIGNWPGVTIEKKVGKIKGTNHEIIDLPGVYSLSPYSTEEEVSRKFIMDEKPDLIINIVDATILERSLYLTTQIMELDCNMIIALNMADMLEKKGLIIDIEKLEKIFGVRIVQISALKGLGVDKLISTIEEHLNFQKTKIFDANIENAVIKIKGRLKKDTNNRDFISIKLIEGDERFNSFLNLSIQEQITELRGKYNTDMEEIIATERYYFIERAKKESVKSKKVPETVSNKLDRIFLNKWIAFPIFIIIMFLIYYLSVGIVGSYTVDLVALLVDKFGRLVERRLINLGCSECIISLLTEGIIAGVGSVLGFIPQLIILFSCISLLETTGYMARIALLLDKVFRRIGLSGKSLIPFIIGSGCSVPGIMGTRIIENEHERKITAILTPFIPCSAKLPIIALFTGYFFPDNSGLTSASLYFLAVAVIILSAFVMKKFIFKDTSNTYISELPEYKAPSIKYISKEVFDKIIAFIKRAGSVILICSIIIWFLLSFSFKFEYGINIEKSMLATIGKTISWIFYPILGTNSWEATVSAIQGLVAKEQVVSSMAVINGLAEDSSEASKIFTVNGVFGFFTPASAYAFMVFNLFSAPCFGAIGAIKKELGGTKKVLKVITYQTILAWILSSIVYGFGNKIEKGTLNVSNSLVIVAILIFVISIIVSYLKKENSECARCPYCKECSKI